MLSVCLLFIYGVNGFGRPQQAARKSRFTTWRRTPSQARPHLGAETVVARPRCGRRWEQMRARHVPDSPKGMGIGLALVRGTYSRVGACPYLLGPIYESRPCKGLISRFLLRGKPRSRYAPLTGAAARIGELRWEIGASPYPKYEPLSGAAIAMLFGQNRAEIFLYFEHPTFQSTPFRAMFVSHVGSAPQKSAGDKGFALCLLRNLFSTNVYGLTY